MINAPKAPPSRDAPPGVIWKRAAIVQPALGLGLIVLLVLGVRLLHERVGLREIAGAVMITAAIAVIGWAAPAHTPGFTRGGEIVHEGAKAAAGAPA